MDLPNYESGRSAYYQGQESGWILDGVEWLDSITTMNSEREAESRPELQSAQMDYVALAAKSILGAVPFVGSLLTELAGTVIPNQRVDRLVKFAEQLNKNIAGLDQAIVRMKFQNEQGGDLAEEALRQAARALSDERRQYISALLARSLTHDEIDFVESRHLLRILGELNDIEVIWLRAHFNQVIGEDEEFRSRHRDVLTPRTAHLGGPKSDVDKQALQASYKDHLAQMGLLSRTYETTTTPNLKLKTFVVPQQASYALTPLGRLLLRYIGFGVED